MKLKFKGVKNISEKRLLLKLNNNFINPKLNSLLNEEEIKNIGKDLKLEDLENDNHFFIRKGKKIVGFWSFRKKSAKIFYISGLYILPKYQNRGFGKKSLNIIIKKFKDLKADYIYLETYKKFTHAINFYEKFGLNYLKMEDFKNSFLNKIYKNITSESLIFYKNFVKKV